MLHRIYFIIAFHDVLHAAVVREWHLGMKISTNGYLGIKEFYNDPCKCNETSTLEDLKAKGRQHYKSCLMRSLINVIQIRVDIYKMDEVKASFLFGSQFTDSTKWFTKGNFISSTYNDTDLRNDTVKVYMSVENSHHAFFQIYQYVPECNKRRRFIWVADLAQASGSCIPRSQGVWVLFSPNKTLAEREELELADFMAVYILQENTYLNDGELGAWMEEIKANLTVPQNTTSSYIRSKLSIYESRTSAVSLGLCGIMVIAFTMIFIIFIDIFNVCIKM